MRLIFQFTYVQYCTLCLFIRNILFYVNVAVILLGGWVNACNGLCNCTVRKIIKFK